MLRLNQELIEHNGEVYVLRLNHERIFPCCALCVHGSALTHTLPRCALSVLGSALTHTRTMEKCMC